MAEQKNEKLRQELIEKFWIKATDKIVTEEFNFAVDPKKDVSLVSVGEAYFCCPAVGDELTYHVHLYDNKSHKTIWSTKSDKYRPRYDGEYMKFYPEYRENLNLIRENRIKNEETQEFECKERKEVPYTDKKGIEKLLRKY